MTGPYISLVFACRDDDYGGQLKERIGCFIGYLAHVDRAFPGLFELVVCDWNPPSPEASLREGYDWSGLGQVTFVTVEPELHDKYVGSSRRPILDYIARNVAIRHAKGQFVCILNQDIFLTWGIFELLAERRLSTRHFYRADRCDFHPDFKTMAALERVEDYAFRHCFAVHRRHSPQDEAIMVPVDTGCPVGEWQGSRGFNGDRVLANKGIVFCEEGRLDAAREQLGPNGKLGRNLSDFERETYYRRFCLHTNAAGDFIIAPRRAFEEIHGFVETPDFYLHLDSYAIVQLYAAGYEQAILVLPHAVFHADHDCSGRLGRPESMDFPEHEKVWSKILMGEIPPQINGPDWGLQRYDLQTIALCQGKAGSN